MYSVRSVKGIWVWSTRALYFVLILALVAYGTMIEDEMVKMTQTGVAVVVAAVVVSAGPFVLYADSIHSPPVLGVQAQPTQFRFQFQFQSRRRRRRS